jgi:hypothetical protein
MNIGAVGLSETLVSIDIQFVNGLAANVSMSLFSDYPVTRRRTSEEPKLGLYPRGNLKTRITQLHGAKISLSHQ